MKIWNIPIESLDERYTKQWNVWFPREFKKLGVEFETVYGDTLSETIQVGSFLDVYSTNHFKSTQMTKLIKLIAGGVVQNDDVIFFNDLWFPGLEALQYIRQGAGHRFRIMGVLHAGTYDPNDFLWQRQMSSWGSLLETCWLSFIDKVFVSVPYHKELIETSRVVSPDKIIVTGLPIYDEFSDPSVVKKNIVVFPHRIVKEKQPDLFDLLKKLLNRSDWEFVRTQDIKRTKEEYMKLLNESKIAVSFALQETWGISMQEALICGCVPIVPNRLSYKDMYFPWFRYDSFDHCSGMVSKYMEEVGIFLKDKNKKLILDWGREAIPNMVEEMIND